MPSLFDFAAEVVHRVFAKCECGACGKYSLGIVCGRCSRKVCLRHGYVTLGAPPESVCAACIMTEHSELLAGGRRTADGGVVIDVKVITDGKAAA